MEEIHLIHHKFHYIYLKNHQIHLLEHPFIYKKSMKTRLHSQIDDISFLSIRRATQQELMSDLKALATGPTTPCKRKAAFAKARSFRTAHRQNNKALVDALLGVATLLGEKTALSCQSTDLPQFCPNNSAIHHTVAQYIKGHSRYYNHES